ncbi:hypothetical protein VCR20J5_280205 [Vibrio crassostreae]|nr:hypothetical protein VCR20J5_280205 [Vibrio crassostreae]
MKTGSNHLLASDYANFGINYFHYFPISIKNKGVNSRQINKTITKESFQLQDSHLNGSRLEANSESKMTTHNVLSTSNMNV